jgi:predicted HicB family RNase H-like nuclease
MTRPKSLQVHVSFELAERVRSAAERRDISVSEWIRSLLQQACVFR